MRLIDADALREVMYHEAFEKDTDMQRWDSGCWIRYKMFENAIDAAPTIEADPVKHGHWEEKTVINCNVDEWQSARCSSCGRYHTTPYLYYFANFDYCPSCGAKMDEGSETE